MAPIDDALAALESREEDASFSYRQVAKKFGCSRTTLARRHQGLARPRAEVSADQQLLSPQQEAELVQSIEGLTRRGLPPTRSMVRNFAREVAKREVGDGWVTRFLTRQNSNLTARYTKGMDRNRHAADNRGKYHQYFELLHSKMRQYNVEPCDIYNMDEKGFLMGIISRSKRIFSKQLWERKEVNQALQDGSREWITLLACVCADGTALDPALIYQGQGPLQSGWVQDVEEGKHQVFLATSPSGWSNDDLGLAWIEQVFDRLTKEKARRRYRLLIVDGHGSHITMAFINYCDANKILLVVFPPHATHSLQPLDVVMFAPLSAAYSVELTTYLHHSQGLTTVKKGDFFWLFWAAWTSSFKVETIKQSFKATGIFPMNAEVVLQRFTTPPPDENEEEIFKGDGDGTSWRDLNNLFHVAVVDTNTVAAKRLSASLHSLQVQNELLNYENKGLRDTVATKKKHANKSKPLEMQQRKKFYATGVFYSPRKVREARALEATKQQQEEAETRRKLEARELRAAAALYKKQQLEARKLEREKVKEVKQKEREEKAKRLAASRAEKQHQKEAENTQKALQLSQRAKRPASPKTAPKNKRARGAVGVQRGEEVGEAAPTELPKLTTRGRQIRKPRKFK
jgi:hypothetical protein